MEEETEFEMGKRPSRQRRHLPTSVTSAVTTRKSTIDSKNIPLLKMSFREKNEPSSYVEQEEKEEIENFGTTTGYTSTTTTVKNTRRKKRTIAKNNHNNNNNNEIKRKAQQFVNTSTVNTSKKKQIIWIISSLWILFILYRIFISLRKEDYGNLSIVHFISNTILNTNR